MLLGTAVTDLWYDLAGAGSDICLLHSGLSDSRSWEPVLPALASTHRVLRYDARGFGRSPVPTDPWDRTEDALAVLDAAGIERAHVIGNSMGATVSRALAILYPARVRSLTLVGPGLAIEEAPPEESQRLLEAWRQALSRGDVEAAVAVARGAWIVGSGQEARLRELLLRQGRAAPEALRLPPAASELERIAVPVLVLAGDRDDPTVLRSSEVIAGRTGAALRLVAGARHHPQEDAPEEFARLVLEFLEEVDAAGR
jgi:3-oxoadipate enol-lactonase